MNRKEVNELRRRLRPDKNNITHIYGCYVNSAKEIVSEIDESVALLTIEENEKYMGLLKKVLSGSLGRNLMDICFATKQVVDSQQVKLLSGLRQTMLEDKELRDSFYQCVISSVDSGLEGFLVLMAHDVYDVPHFGKDGQHDGEDSDVYKYILCCVCPVVEGKVQFGYSSEEKRFHNLPGGQVVAAPELGFLYPCFDDRTANIYNALLYSRNLSEDHKPFIDAVFNTPAPMPAEVQRETFHSILCDTLEESCSFEVMHAVHNELNDRIAVHKESKDPEPLVISPEEMGDILEDCGADAERVHLFEEKYRETLGDSATLSPSNIIGNSKLILNTADIKIQVPAELSHLVNTRVLDGKKYILISADSGVEINGVPVSISEE